VSSSAAVFRSTHSCAYHIGQATFFRRWAAEAHETISDPHALTEAVELGADWTFAYIEKLSDGLVQRYGDERERWVRRAAAVRAQVINALLASEQEDLERASRRLGYELERNHLAFGIWSDAPHDRGDVALAMIDGPRSSSCRRSEWPRRCSSPARACASLDGSDGAATIRSSGLITHTSTFSRFRPYSRRSARLGSAWPASPAAIARRFTPAESRS
jgi:hypothetical protein